MQFRKLVLAFLFAASVVSADVSTTNSYYTTGSECHEEVFLHNMDYSNSVSIDDGNFNANSQASTSDDSGTSRFQDIARMTITSGDSQGASLGLSAKDLGNSRSLKGGSSNSIGFSYFLESGASYASYFTPFSLFNEDITLANSRYTGDIQLFNFRTYSSGEGKISDMDAPSSFNDTISMRYVNKQCNIKSFLMPFNGASGQNYTWSSYSGQRNFAIAGIRIKALQGHMKLGISGTSTFLDDKFSPDPEKNETFPLTFSIPRDLLVEYVLS